MFASLAELALIRLALNNQHLVLSSGLDPDMFSPQNRRAWEILYESAREHRAVTEQDFASFNEKYRDEIFSPLNLPFGTWENYVNEIRTYAIPRRANELAEQLHRIANDPQTAPLDKQSLFHGLIMQYFHTRSEETFDSKGVTTVVREWFEDLLVNGVYRRVVTGFSHYDHEMVIGAEGLYMFAGASGIGKTQLMAHILWQNKGRRCYYQSVEVDPKAMYKRMASSLAGWNPQWWKQNDKQITPDMISRYSVALNKIEEIFEADKADPNLRVAYGSEYIEFESTFLRAHFKNPYDYVVIDHLNDMTIKGGRPEEFARANDVLEMLKDMSVRLQMPILVVAQLKKLSVDTVPTGADIRYVNRDKMMGITLIYKDRDSHGDESIIYIMQNDKNREGVFTGKEHKIAFMPRNGMFKELPQ